MCSHENYIIDPHEGENICTSCGIVLSKHYEDEFLPVIEHQQHSANNNKWIDEATTILDMLHLPSIFLNKIMEYFDNNYQQKSISVLIFSIYKILNDDYGVVISLKDLSNVTGVNKTSIFAAQKKGDNIILDTAQSVEKYATALDLNWGTIALIKDYINKHQQSGHSPSTILAGSIYIVCKKLKLKLSIRKIAKATATSQISIQRFVKKHVYS